MPIYEYQCEVCGTIVERLIPMSKVTAINPCTVPDCTGIARKIVSANSRQSDYWSECTKDNPRNSENTKNFINKGKGK